jgi:hypothetical protein
MLVARRDPELDADDRMAHAGASSPRFKRIMSGLQMAGTLVGIPVALASGYSVYRSNFSPEASCQGLRTNIIAMLDKSADASTLRTLVRRDVAAFEQSCGAVDPDAVAAFKTLLTAPTQPPVAKAAPPKAEAKTAVREPAQRLEAPRPPAKAPVVESQAVRDKEISDANWLAAVRGALVTHDQDRPPQTDITAAPMAPAAPEKPLVAPALRETHVVAPPAGPAQPLAPSAPAPTLPPAAAPAPAPAPVADNHPVPPESIPDAPPPEPVVQAEHRPGRLRALLSHIPVLNRALADDN